MAPPDALATPTPTTPALSPIFIGGREEVRSFPRGRGLVVPLAPIGDSDASREAQHCLSLWFSVVLPVLRVESTEADTSRSHPGAQGGWIRGSQVVRQIQKTNKKQNTG